MVIRLLLMLVLAMHPAAYVRAGGVALPHGGTPVMPTISACDPGCLCCTSDDGPQACCGCASAPLLPPAPEPVPAPGQSRDHPLAALSAPRPSGLLWPEVGTPRLCVVRANWVASLWTAPTCEGLCVWRT